jgi:hypothetical protein
MNLFKHLLEHIPVPLIPGKSFAELAELPNYHNFAGISWIDLPLHRIPVTPPPHIPAVPEASTWLMALAGIAVIGLWKRFR